MILQCDTQADSFLLALNADTGETVWKTERDELPSWGTPTVVDDAGGPELVTNASNFIRGYDPRTGKELWRLGGSSKITAPTPIAADGLFVVASGRAPERPIFVVGPARAATSRSASGETSERGGRLEQDRPRLRTCRRRSSTAACSTCSANNGVFDAYDLQTGEEVYRQRLPHVGSGFSASPVAADGKIYLSSEDGEMLVVAAGPDVQAHRDQLDGRAADGDAGAVGRRDVRALVDQPLRHQPEMQLRRLRDSPGAVREMLREPSVAERGDLLDDEADLRRCGRRASRTTRDV